jgi:phosphatidylserine/phosphatidylglycerophosphate/cardiolipin synthase-like enzyme
VRIEVLAEGTERRVPREIEAQLLAAGIAVTRVPSTPHVTMHAKFCLIEDGAEREVWFGSANWSDRSFLRNFEVLARSRDPELFAAFARDWERIERFAAARDARVRRETVATLLLVHALVVWLAVPFRIDEFPLTWAPMYAIQPPPDEHESSVVWKDRAPRDGRLASGARRRR